MKDLEMRKHHDESQRKHCIDLVCQLTSPHANCCLKCKGVFIKCLGKTAKLLQV